MLENLVSVTTPAERYAAAKRRSASHLTNQFAESFDFPFDDFQIEGCREIEAGNGVLIAAPTGAGKTIVGEFATFLSEKKGFSLGREWISSIFVYGLNPNPFKF